MKYIGFNKIPVEKVMGFFRKYFPESEGYSVNSVVFDKKEKCFVVECTGVDNETKERYSFSLAAYNPLDERITSDEVYPIAWSCPAYNNDFWTGDEVQEEYPKFIRMAKKTGIK